MALQLAVIALSLIPPLFAPAAVYVHIDPFTYTFPKLFPRDTLEGSIFLQSILLTMRVLASAISVIEACRFYTVIFPLISYWLEMQLSTIEILHQIPSGRLNENSFFKWYTTLQVTVQIYDKSMDSIIGLTTCLGFWICVACNIGTIRAFNILPFIVYWLLPTVSMISIFLIAILIPLMIESNTRTIQIIKRRKWEHKLVCGYGKTQSCLQVTKELKSNIKRYDSIKPIVLNCAGLYRLKKGSEVTFFYLINLRWNVAALF